jgi:hypothetical protein
VVVVAGALAVEWSALGVDFGQMGGSMKPRMLQSVDAAAD